MAGANQLLSSSYIRDPVFSKTLGFSCSSVSLLHKLLIPANWAIASFFFFFPFTKSHFLLATAFSRWSMARKKYALKWVWKTENLRMASPDARLYVDLAAALTTEFVRPQCAITLLPMFFFFLPFFSFGVIFALISFFTSNAPKLFCGCRQPNTLWCLCMRKRPNLFVCNVHKCCSVRNLY